MIFRTILLILFLTFLGCNQPKNVLIETTFDEKFIKQNKLTDEELKTWQYKDIETDTIPGISLDRAYNKILKHQKSKDSVIVAIIDSGLDIEHEAIKGHIWVNGDEVAGNGIDDDGNGYIDDIHGWNFLGKNLLYANLEITRIIRKYQAQFKSKTEENLFAGELEEYQNYKHLLKIYDERLEAVKKRQKIADYMIELLEQSQKFIEKKIGKTSYTIENIEKIVTQDSIEKRYIAFTKNFLSRDIKPKSYYTYQKSTTDKFDYHLNIDYDDRQLIGDNPYDITQINYGNNDIVGFLEEETHSTRVSGMITSYNSPDKKIRGISSHIKIMPLRVSPEGEAYDKDVALSIRYAVDNGAKVINMSFSKEYFTHKQWVVEAMKYAQENDVLIVTAAVNSGLNIDDQEAYLDDTDENNKNEIIDNFIKVGASASILDKNLVATFSNYSKLKVDIFAPGAGVYTIWPNQEDKLDSGTSLSSAMVSGIAALIRVYYPELSVVEVKEVILQSGVSYDIMVDVPGTNGKEQKPFSEFSKSGKIANAYNALLMAKQVAKEK